MQRWRDVTIGDLIDGLKRYQPFLLTVLVVVLIVTVLPGRDDDQEVAASGTSPTQRQETQTTAGNETGTTASTTGGRGQAASSEPTEATAGEATEQQAAAEPAAFGGQEPAPADAPASPNCDPQTGRIKVPSVYAPPCPPPFDGNNGGETSRGVSGDTVKIAVYIGELDPATGAILRAAGAEDDPDDVWQTYNDYKDYFEEHYETWGRKLELIRIDGGQPDDDVKAQQNAQEIIDKGAFIALNGPTDTNIYMQMLAEAGVVCVCTVSQPMETYLNHAPYVYATLMSSTQLYTHRAEYVGKRLWGDKAEHAGDAAYHLRDRTFALVYFDTAQKTYKAGADYFMAELNKYGAEAMRVQVTGAHVDTAGAQREAPTVSQKLKDAEITSVVFAGDPLYPIFLTKEATEDRYFPEWIITGSVFSDTAVFARLYNQAQWANAFGLSALSARTSEDLAEAWRVHLWHLDGKEPVADGQYSGIIYPNFWIGATGIHMAGPTLTAETFRDGLFAYPRSGDGPVHGSSSFGTGLWNGFTTLGGQQFVDYLRLDDMTEIWWDTTQSGESEIGVQGTGLYRYVDGGKRYQAGQWPGAKPKVFCCNDSTSLIYESYEEVPDKWPQYDHEAHE